MILDMEEKFDKESSPYPSLVITTDYSEEATAVSKMLNLSIRNNQTNDKQRSHSVFNTDSLRQDSRVFIPTQEPIPLLSHSLTVPDLFSYQRRSESLQSIAYWGHIQDIKGIPELSGLQARRHSHQSHHHQYLDRMWPNTVTNHRVRPSQDLSSHHRHSSCDLYGTSNRDMKKSSWKSEDNFLERQEDLSPSVSETGGQKYDNVFFSSCSQILHNTLESEQISCQDIPLDLSVRSRSFSNTSTGDVLSITDPGGRHSTLSSSSSSDTGSRGQEGVLKKVEEYPCTMCLKLFRSEGCLLRHIRLKHKSSSQTCNTKTHACNVCKRKFARSDMLNRHMRLHTGFKPYGCRICGQVFSRSDHLATHQRTHTGEKPYKCPGCSYSACRRDMITRHLRTHTRQDNGKQ